MAIEDLTDSELAELVELMEEELKDKARAEHLTFVDYCWSKPKDSALSEPFVVGFHTQKICERIDRAIEDFRNGKSSYVWVSVHPRSGKSDLISRYLPPHLLGEFPSAEVLSVSYKDELASGFAEDARNIFRSDAYKQLYPDIGLSRESNAKDRWKIVSARGQNLGGMLNAMGLYSGLTGKGAHFAILDDYLKGRADAESQTMRDAGWHAFKESFMTRLAPVHIVFVLATWWHEDDIRGRVEKEMRKNPDFPQFEFLSFPARAKDYKGEGQYKGEFLFEERFSKTHYRKQYAVLGPYSSAALLDCNPQPRTGGRFDLNYIAKEDFFPTVHQKRFIRVWDLAHTAKQRAGDDPDYTSGTLLTFEYIPGDPVPHLWVADVKRMRENAPQRDKIIKEIIHRDTTHTRQFVEASIDAKDAYEYLSDELREYNIYKVRTEGDKGARATPLEAIFAAPFHVHVPKDAEWLDDWVEELARFDGTGKDHDDQVDNLSAGYIVLIGEQIADEEVKRAMSFRHTMRKSRKESGYV